MSSISVSVNTTNFRQRYTKYISQVKAQLSSDWKEVTEACLQDVVSRTPSQEVEYAYIQGYEGGEFEGMSPHPVISSDGARQSFVRTPGTWLQDLVLSPTTYTANPSSLSLNLGHLEALQDGSKFGWVNYNKKDGSMPQTSEYGVFTAFEYGLHTTQKPIFGDNYRLKPYGDESPQYLSSSKSYPRLGLYTLFNYSVFSKSVYSIAKRVEF